MIKRNCKILIIIMFLAMTCHGADNKAEVKEYRLKSAFIYNFIKFTEFPEESFSEPNSPINMVLLGVDKYKDVFRQ